MKHRPHPLHSPAKTDSLQQGAQRFCNGSNNTDWTSKQQTLLQPAPQDEKHCSQPAASNPRSNRLPTELKKPSAKPPKLLSASITASTPVFAEVADTLPNAYVRAAAVPSATTPPTTAAVADRKSVV